jgi:uncharacterized protein (TIGR02284 family)
MSSAHYNIEALSSLVHVLNSGIDFYREAKEKVADSQTQPYFDRMISRREMVKQLLIPYAKAETGDFKALDKGSNFALEARHWYTTILAKIASDEQHTWVSQLEEVEDKTLEKFDEVIAQGQSVACEAALQKGRELMQSCHDQMLSLQKATKH